MRWSVTYVDETEFTSDDGPWPPPRTDGVLWVDVTEGEYSHRLKGHDHYWLNGVMFGVWNHHPYPLFRQRWSHLWYWLRRKPYRVFAWKWADDGNGSVDLGPMMPPPGSHVVDGGFVPDERARELGLLS